MNQFIDYFRNSEMLSSKKFRAFVAGLVILLLENYGVTTIEPEIVDHIVFLILGYMGFQGGVDMIKAYSGYYNK